jgi:hypothetical protein
MNTTMRMVLGLALAIWPGAAALAWSGAGHQVIAAQAYNQLPAKLQKAVAETLKAHPDYEKWAKSYTGDGTGLDLAEYIFIRSSTWPDEIRRHGNPYDHAQWHYVDYALRPPGFALEPEPSPTNNIVWGLGQCEKILADPKTAAADRAAYLSWLIHLVGDIHQPLHCSSLFTAAYPEGDRGGNEFYVMPASRGIKLHSLWDGLLGTSGKPRAHANYARELQAAHPRKSLKELTRARTPRDWSLESRALALDQAYRNGTLKGSTRAEDAPSLPEGYTQTAKSVAEKRAALAGCRLADEIKRCCK